MDGIGWVIFWKDGRSWHADTIFAEIDDDNPDPEYDPISVDTKEYLEMIYNRDYKAIILNGYYCSSFYEDESLTEWVKHVRYCYEIQLENAYQVKKFLEQRKVVLTEKDKKDIAEAIEVKEKAEAVLKAIEAKEVERIEAKDIKIIEDYNGNRYSQVDSDAPCKDATRLVGDISAKKVNGEICLEHKAYEISLKKEDRRTLNGVMFAKIV